MPVKTSIEVVRSERSCRSLVSALLGQGAMVSTILLGIVRPSLGEGASEPGFLSSIHALAHTLVASIKKLVTADEALYDANADLQILRAQRDSLANRLGKKIVRFRKIVEGFFKAPALTKLGLQSPTNRQPDHLLRQSDRIDESFQADDLEEMLGEKNFAEAPDVRNQAAEIRPMASELRTKLEEIEEAKRQHDTALVHRNKVKDEHDNLFLHVARSFESQCRIADEHELADRVRPSERVRGLTQQHADEFEDDGAASDGAGPPGGSASPAADSGSAVTGEVAGNPI